MPSWQRAIVWIALLIPLLPQLQGYLSGTAFYGETLHRTGEVSVWLLLLVLAITPVRRLFPKAAWSAWLIRARRDLGIGTFVYALAHTVIYLQRKADLARILREATEPGILVGWLALLGMLLLAITSNDRSVRWLGVRWKGLHRLVYGVALLSVLHWLLTAFDPAVGYLHLGLLGVLLLSRGISRRQGI